jgi:hypothetical protein
MDCRVKPGNDEVESVTGAYIVPRNKKARVVPALFTEPMVAVPTR